MKLKLIFLSALATILSLTSFASDTPPGDGDAKRNDDLFGGVIESDSKKPLSNVSVTAYSASKKEKVTITDVNGNFSFSDLKPGTYKLVFEKSGYKKVTKERYVVRDDEPQQINVQMEEHKSFDFMPGSSQFFDF
jgi:hypothetical protein